MTGFGRVEGRRRNFAVSQAVRKGPGAAILSLPRESQGLSFLRQPYFAQYSTIQTMINFDAKGCRSYHTMASISTLAAKKNSVVMRYEDIQISKLAAPHCTALDPELMITPHP